MKSILPLLFILALALLSCKRKDCYTYGIMGFNANTDVVRKDSVFTVVRYMKDGTFAQPIDSVRAFYRYTYGYPNEYTTNSFFVMLDTLKAKSTDYFNYDYRGTLYPSGIRFNITGLRHDAGKGDPGLSCVNAIHFKLNGQEISQPGYLGMQGFVVDLKF